MSHAAPKPATVASASDAPRTLGRLAAWGLAVLCGVLVFTSFPFSTEPDSNLWVFGWFALVPLFVALEGRTRWAAFRLGWLAGFVTNFGGFWWISEVLRDFGHLPPAVTWPLTALNAAVQGLVFAIVAALLAPRQGDVGSQARPGIWRIAATYTVVEWCFPMLFPWFMGNGQYRFLPAIQVAELGGVPAVTFVMLLVNAALFRLVQAARSGGGTSMRGRLREVAVPLATALCAILYGFVRLPMVEADIAAAEKLKLGLVEANIGIFEKEARHLGPREKGLTLHRNLLKHQWMSRELADAGVDLVVWPESSYFPITDPVIKQTDHFLLAATPDGAVVAGDPRDTTSPPEGVGPRAAAGAPPLAALTAVREGGWLAVGGTMARSPDGAVVVEGATALRAAALVAPDGRSPERASSPLEAVVAGDGGFVAVAPWPGLTRPRRLASPGPGAVLAAAPTRDGTVWLVGEGGLVWQLRRGRLTAESSPVTQTLRAVASDGDVAWAVGDAGTVLALAPHGAWERVPGPDAANLTAVAIDRAGDVWVGGAGGLFVREAVAWRRHAPEPVTALVADPRDGVIVRSEAGRLRRVGSAPERVMTDVEGWPGGVTAIASGAWIQASPFPKDTRWVRQSRARLPSLEAFDADPEAELHGLPPADLAPVQRGFEAPVLFGGLTWANAPEDAPPGSPRRTLYNTALLLGEDGRLVGAYDKVHLLAFGEYLPFGETFPELYDALPQAGRFTPGGAAGVIPFRGHRLGLMICYEDILASFTADLARERPNVILNITNDAWFGRTSEPHLHLALAVFRAVENRLVLVRSTNTGVSAIIEPTGLLRAQTGLDEAETLVADVAMLEGGTPYSATGHAFAWFLLAALLTGPVLARVRQRGTRAPARVP